MNSGLSGTKRKPHTWLITGLLASAAVGYVVLAFLPGQKSLGELRAQIQERHQQIVQAQSIARPIALAQEQLAATHKVGLAWRDSAPRANDLSTHLARLTQEAEAAQVSLQRLDPMPAVDLNLLSQQNISLQFTGSFASAFELLHRLEALPGTIWIREFRLTKDDDPTRLRGEMTLTIFVDRTDYFD